MPWTPDFKLFQHASTVLPTGLMTPRPVTTTLRMVFSIGIGPPFNGEGPQTLPPKMLHRNATIHPQHLTGDIGRGGQKRHCLSHFLGLAHPSQRDGGQEPVVLAGQVSGHIRLDKARGHRVAGDPLGGPAPWPRPWSGR